MTCRVWLIFALIAVMLSGCSNGDVASPVNQQDAQSWWEWHDKKQEIDMAVFSAINEPGGGDYAKAADIIRNSDRPPAVKQYQIGQLVVGGIIDNARRRAPESLEQGVRMMEDSLLAPGQKALGVAQQLRIMFERGGGGSAEPGRFPVDGPVAACWLEIEEHRSSDPTRCIALRRQRLPDLDHRTGDGRH